MRFQRRSLPRMAIGFGAALGWLGARPAWAAEIGVLCSNGLQSVMEALRPRFEAASGDRIDVVFGASNVLKERIDGGAAFDLTVLTPALIEQLIQSGRVARGSERTIARAGLGLAVRAGAPRPDISTLAAFRQTLLEAESIIYSAAGQSGIGFLHAIDTMGIGAEVRAKARPNSSGPNGAIVARGEAQMAVQLIPELLPVPGIDVVGPFPPDVQSWVVLAGGVATNAASAVRARALLDFLAGAENAAAIREKGLEPA